MIIWPKMINSHDISIFTFKTENCIKFIYIINFKKFNSKTFDDFNFKSLDTLFVHARVQIFSNSFIHSFHAILIEINNLPYALDKTDLLNRPTS